MDSAWRSVAEGYDPRRKTFHTVLTAAISQAPEGSRAYAHEAVVGALRALWPRHPLEYGINYTDSVRWGRGTALLILWKAGQILAEQAGGEIEKIVEYKRKVSERPRRAGSNGEAGVRAMAQRTRISEGT